MTPKPKTRKAPAAKTGINPKLAALAAKYDAELARYENIVATVESSSERDDITDGILSGTPLKIEQQLARVRATNLDELQIKAERTGTEPPMTLNSLADRSSAIF